MTDEEAGSIRATLIDRLGRARPGAQTAEGGQFSAGTFLTNWNKMTPRARASLFPDKGLRNDLNDIATLAEGTSGSQRLQNTSNTAGALMGSAQGNLAVQSPAWFLTGGVVQHLTGRLMASPRFARILARTGGLPEDRGRRVFLEQAAVLATREGARRGDLTALMSAVNDNGTAIPSAMAQEQDR
jgi:hypothetical protein